MQKINTDNEGFDDILDELDREETRAIERMRLRRKTTPKPISVEAQRRLSRAFAELELIHQSIIRRLEDPDKKPKKLYFAHPFGYRKAALKIELRLEKELGIELLNPFYGTSELELMKKIDSGKLKLWQAREVVINGAPDETVQRDFAYCRDLDGTLALFPHRFSIGTPEETLYTFLNAGPLYVITYEKNRHHPFLTYNAPDTTFTSTDGFIKYWKAKYP